MDKVKSIDTILKMDTKIIKGQYSAIQSLRFTYKQPSLVRNNGDANFIKTPFQEDVDGLIIGVSLPWNYNDKINFWTTAA
jgi:hypothetical protein